MVLVLALAALPLLAIVAWLTGSLLLPRIRFESWIEAMAIRMAAGAVMFTTALFFLGLAGVLRPVWIGLLTATIVVAAAMRARRIETPPIKRQETHFLILLMLALVPLIALAAFPAAEFDETLYHLPAVERFALTGALPFITDLRMPVFPHFQEVLEVPLFQLGGSAATHAVSLFGAALIAMFLFDFAHRGGNAISGLLASALFLGLPLAAHLATSGNVDMFLACFVVAALFCAERCRRVDDLHWPVLAGVFAGAASSVKYLGLFWLAATIVLVFVASAKPIRRQAASAAIVSALLVLAPWYARILFYTGNPLFPFLPSIFGATDWSMDMPPHQSLLAHLRSMLRAPLDTIFDRRTIGIQPPLTPWFLLTIPLVVLRRDRITRIALALSLLWMVIWTWLPRDVRYLLPVIAIVCAVGAPAITAEFGEPPCRRGTRVAIAVVLGVVVLSGLVYPLWRIQQYGGVPCNAEQAADYLRRRIPAFTGITRLNAVAQAGERAFLCGGEELFFHFRIPVAGDYTGPARYDRFRAQTAGELARAMRKANMQYIVVVRNRCSLYPRESPVFTIIYEDSFVRIARLKGEAGTR